MPGERGFRPGPKGGPMGAMGAVARPGNFKGAIRRLTGYLKKHIPVIVTALLFAQAGMILNLIGPGKLSQITALIKEGMDSVIDTSAVFRIAVFLVALYVAGFVFSLIEGMMMAGVTQKISRQMRHDISQKINDLPLAYFDRTTIGDVLSRVTNDVDTIAQTLSQSLGNLVADLTMFIGCLIMMFVTNVYMAVCSVASALLGFILMKVIIRRSQKYFIKQQYGLGAINGLIEETYTGQSVVKAYNGEKQAMAKFKMLNTGLYNSAWKSQFSAGLMPPLMVFIGNFGYVVVCVAGAVLTMRSMIGFEVIVAFIFYIRLFTQPLNDFATVATSLQSAAAASERVFSFLDEPEMIDESEKPAHDEKVRGDVDFDHVKFGYVQDKPIIHDFSAHVSAGQKIAIVGPTGAGKTTMVNLLMRFYETWSGQILIDGVPINELTRTEVHDRFCMVLQDTWLFEGSILENVRYSKTEATKEDVIKACKAVGLHYFITTLPDGYDTVLSDNAALSAGQKQLVTIARAMVENAPMLILDEATSSVDTRTEVVIQKAMDELMNGRTSFVIAHRLSTIRNADLILFMKDGDIAESGTHDELMEKGGMYAQLYNSQFETVA